MANETELTERLRRLEADARRWRWVAMAATALAVIAMILGARTLRTPSQLRIVGDDGASLVLHADNLEFRDDTGTVAASIETDHHVSRFALSGGSTVTMSTGPIASVELNAPGNEFAKLSVSGMYSELSLQNGDEFAHLETADTLSARLLLGGNKDQGRGMVALTNGGKQLYPRLQLSAKEATPTIVLEAKPQGSNIQIDDA